MDYDNVVYCILLYTACSFWDFCNGTTESGVYCKRSERAVGSETWKVWAK